MSVAGSEQTAVRELSTAQALEIFDAQAQREVGVSGEEFLRCYRAGRLPEQWSDEAVARMEMLLPLVH